MSKSFFLDGDGDFRKWIQNQNAPNSNTNGSSNPQYIIQDSWATSGIRNLTNNACKLYINNTGVADLTFTIGSLTITVKSNESFEEIFDSFNQVVINATSTFSANVYALKLGSPNPDYSTKDVFSGSANTIRNFSGNVYGLVVSNDGASALTYTVNGITLTVESGEVSEKYFDAFTSVAITSTVPFRAYAKSSYGIVITGSTSGTVDTNPPTVTASPNGGLFNSTQNVTLTASETATIYYTTDGSTPTTNSTIYSNPISVATTNTLKFFAKDTSGNLGTVQTATFTIDTVAPTVTISPLPGTYASNQAITLSANETSTIYYTTDGSTPTTSSTVYSTPITVSATETIKYFAKDTVGNNGVVQTASYTINSQDTTPPDSVTNLTVGTPTNNSIPVTWTLPTATDVANFEVAYSTDGTNYTVSSSTVNATSTSYTVNSLNSSTQYTIRVVAIDTSGNRSTPATVTATTLSATGYHLYFNGTGGIQLPTGKTFDTVVMDATIYTNNTGNTTNNGYLVDLRNSVGGINNGYVYNGGVGNGISQYYLNGVAGTDKTTFWASIPKDVKNTLKFVGATTGTGGGSIFMRNSYNDTNLRADVYTVKLYNGATLVASYDFTNQFSGTTISDISGNGNNATIFGSSTWVAN